MTSSPSTVRNGTRWQLRSRLPYAISGMVLYERAMVKKARRRELAAAMEAGDLLKDRPGLLGKE